MTKMLNDINKNLEWDNNCYFVKEKGRLGPGWFCSLVVCVFNFTLKFLPLKKVLKELYFKLNYTILFTLRKE